MDTEFQWSAQTEVLDEALSKVQGEVEAASKSLINLQFGTKYADLSAVWEACREPLAKHSVSITQWPVHRDDDRLHLYTRVACKGQWMLCHFSMPVAKLTPQGYGIGITYARRYCLSALLGIVADDDDDGNSASTQPARPSQPKPPPKPAELPPPTRTDEDQTAGMIVSIQAFQAIREVNEFMLENMGVINELTSRDEIKAAANARVSALKAAKSS